MNSLLLALSMSSCSLVGQMPESSSSPLPRVEEMAIPKYPLLARVARITGKAEFHVRTDGIRISEIIKSVGPRQLLGDLAKQLATWKFVPHKPTDFTITFDLSLASESVCPPGKPDEIKLLLPNRIELFSTNVMECDPVIVKSP